MIPLLPVLPFIFSFPALGCATKLIPKTTAADSFVPNNVNEESVLVDNEERQESDSKTTNKGSCGQSKEHEDMWNIETFRILKGL